MTFPIHRLSIQLAVKNPPEAIYLQGSAEGIALLAELPSRGLAVVGTRRPQPRAESLVRRVILDLKRSSLIIVSGLALGIDARAHEAALEAGLPTVAFLGCGLNHQYPPENLELRQDILNSGGLVISEYPPEQTARPGHFILRNRLIAGLSKATWMVQAPLQSGALNTAGWARDQERNLYVTPCFPGDPSFAGNQKLLDSEIGATQIWNASSFGHTWRDLPSWVAMAGKKDRPKPPIESTDPILAELNRRTAQSGGTTTSELLDWAFGEGISPTDLFERLQKAQECGSVSDRNGVLATT